MTERMLNTGLTLSAAPDSDRHLGRISAHIELDRDLLPEDRQAAAYIDRELALIDAARRRGRPISDRLDRLFDYVMARHSDSVHYHQDDPSTAQPGAVQ